MDRHYVSKFKFNSMEDMHAFEHAWTAFNLSLRRDLVEAALVRAPTLAATLREVGLEEMGNEELTLAMNRVTAKGYNDKTEERYDALHNEFLDAEQYAQQASEARAAPDSQHPGRDYISEAMKAADEEQPVVVRVRLPQEATEYIDRVSAMSGEDRDTVATVMFAMASARWNGLDAAPVVAEEQAG